MINVDELIKKALKEGNKIRLKVYRNLKSEIMNFKTQKNAPEYTEAAEISIIKKYVSKMEDAEKQYSEAAREDLVSECRDELEVLRKLLPEPVTESELSDWIMSTALDRNWVGTDDVSTRIMIPKKEMGNLIKQVKSTFPTADGKMIADIVKANLE